VDHLQALEAARKQRHFAEHRLSLGDLRILRSPGIGHRPGIEAGKEDRPRAFDDLSPQGFHGRHDDGLGLQGFDED
jgi:hypothetical protein